ncbi:carbohydrate-binding protein [Streptomyces sp. 6N223]|uniref:carbohydrate-binding protein n=1 Tax=Streptomyces sp. 6N223 TaxID=3457412 RepID=UPI003FD4D70D
MSAGNNGAGMPPEHDDDPFAYLYRPEGGQSADGQQPPARPPRQPSSYHQVRPVGERTFGGQRPQQGYGYPQPPPQQPRQPQPDAYYAAPETQPGGPGGAAGAPGRRRPPPPEAPRRNGLLIGAIAVVLAVVVGVGAAILFSGDESDPTAGDDPTGSETQDTGGDGGNGEESPSEEPTNPSGNDELPAADITALQLGGTARVASGVEGARSPDGSYIEGLASGSSITWTFDFEGKAGQYYLYTTYSAISDGQTLDFSLNGSPRSDGVNLDDYNNTGEWDTSWTNTYNYVDLEPGEYTVQFSCSASCDVLIDQIFLSETKLDL